MPRRQSNLSESDFQTAVDAYMSGEFDDAALQQMGIPQAQQEQIRSSARQAQKRENTRSTVDRLESFGVTAKDVLTGFGKEVGERAVGVGSFMNRNINEPLGLVAPGTTERLEPGIRAALEPTNPAQRAGGIAENVAEFFVPIPGMRAAKTATLARRGAPLARRALGGAARVGLEGAQTGAITLGQTGDTAEATRAAGLGAVGGLAGEALRPVVRGARATLGGLATKTGKRDAELIRRGEQTLSGRAEDLGLFRGGLRGTERRASEAVGAAEGPLLETARRMGNVTFPRKDQAIKLLEKTIKKLGRDAVDDDTIAAKDLLTRFQSAPGNKVAASDLLEFKRMSDSFRSKRSFDEGARLSRQQQDFQVLADAARSALKQNRTAARLLRDQEASIAVRTGARENLGRTGLGVNPLDALLGLGAGATGALSGQLSPSEALGLGGAVALGRNPSAQLRGAELLRLLQAVGPGTARGSASMLARGDE